MYHGEQRTLCISSEYENVRKLAEFCRATCSSLFSSDELDSIELALVEATNNIIEHAYRNRPGNPIELGISNLGTQIELSISNTGFPFNPSEVNAPESDLQDIPDRGWGMMIMRALMDDISFQYISGVNHLIMRKNLPEENPLPKGILPEFSNFTDIHHLIKEMEVATDFHHKLTEENIPQIPGLSLFAKTEPALEIGGDYLGFRKVHDSQIWFMICDAMGKGISAGFFSVLCHMTFQSILFIHDGMTPGQLLTFTNKIMEKEFDKFGMFMTSLVGRVDLARNNISYASAGHSQPIIFSEEEGAELLDTPDFMMGVDSHLAYTTVTVPFKKGMKFLCYTDGITDITDPQGNMVGVEPLLQTCSSQFSRKGIVEACDSIFSDAMMALGPSLQDDITMIGIESV